MGTGYLVYFDMKVCLKISQGLKRTPFKSENV